MEKKCSAWVLCPSKRFPGQYYYFNTQTGEKAWSWTVPADQTPDGKPEEKPQPKASFGKVEFPKYLHNHAINPRKNYATPSSMNTPNVIGAGPSFTPRSRESEQQVSTTTHTNYKLAPAQFKAIPNNPFSLRLPEPLRTDSRKVCEGIASKNSVFEPIFTNTFFNVVNERQKRRSNTDIGELSQAMKKVKISSTSSRPSEQDTPERNSDEVNYHFTKCDDDAASLITQNPSILRQFRNENVKVCINFLRNLSISKNTDTWYLVPDVEVLLDNFNFLQKFIAGDQTCSVMTPAAVLTKLEFLRDNCRAVDSRATVAGQVIQWLTKNSVCQSNKLDNCSLDDPTIHKEIVEYCKEVNIFHVVIITKSKNLYDQAKRNDIHAYYFNALKIIDQTDNLFLHDPNNTNTFKWPATPSANSVLNKERNACKNLGIRVNRNSERSLMSHTFDGREISNVFEGHTNKNKSLENVRISTKNDSTLTTTGGFLVEENIREFSKQHTHLQANVNERIDECTCSFLQIMEHCLHNVFQRISSTQFDPPCWLHEGLQLLKKLYYQNKQLCAIVEHLISMCAFCLKNGIMRPIIKSDMFVKILGAGILLIEQLEKILECPEFSDCKEMLSDLTAIIQTAEEFPAVFSISLECRRILGDEPFRMEGVKSTDNGRCNSFVSGIERTPQHKVINTEPNCNGSELQQNQSELFDIQACGGSIQLFRDDMLDGNISKPNFDQNQDKTIQSIDSNQNNIIQSMQCMQNKSNAAFQPNHFNSNQDKTIQSIDSNQYNTIQSIQCTQNKSNGAFKPNHFNSNQDKTIQSIDSNRNNTIKSVQSIQNKSNAAFQLNHFNSNHDKTIQSIVSNRNNTIQSMQSIQNRANAAFQPNRFNSNQDKTIQSIDSNRNNTIQSIQCMQNKSNAAIQKNNEEMQITDNAVNCMTVSSEKQSDKSSSVILQTIDNGGAVFQKLENTVDMIRHALTRMKLFIEFRMEELKKGAIPDRRKECLREKSVRLLDCAAGMFETLKIIQKRENPNDPSFGKKIAVRNPAYTECIEHCLEQVKIMHRSFIFLLEALAVVNR